MERDMEVLLDGKEGYFSSRVCHVPQLGYHRMTVSELCKLGIRVVFDEYTVSIEGKEVKGGSMEPGVYKLHGQSSVEHGVYSFHGQSSILNSTVEDEVPLPKVQPVDAEKVADLPSNTVETDEVPIVRIPKWLLDTLKESGMTMYPPDWSKEGLTRRSRRRPSSAIAELLQVNYSLMSFI
ncbi:hypothetical protein L7F22_051547 [Adiantum nelumboides]|nr:hypothetical protein [Adiantum nelumboides]